MRLTLVAALAMLSTDIAGASIAWVQMAPGSKVLARTVVEGSCPSITIDGNSAPMQARSAPNSNGKAPANQRLTCESDVTGARRASIGAAQLSLPVDNPKRILVLGDTGCRIKAGPGSAKDTDHEEEKVKVQDCNDPKQWPFAAVAKNAAAAKPDLVIHVGDYIYRESPCPADKSSACGGTPWGDNWTTWETEFFAPAQPLLAAAPWIFVRGNHEICARVGKGWSYYLDAGAYNTDGQCRDGIEHYLVKLGSFSAAVLDSSNLPDAGPTPQQVESTAKTLAAIGSAAPPGTWLVSHRPLWAAKAGHKGARDNLVVLNATLQGAWARTPQPNVGLIVAGHTHLFELLSFGAARPTQLVIGNGGTGLANAIKAKLTGKSIGDATVVNGTTFHDFGYAVMTPLAGASGWRMQMRDAGGVERLSCELVAGKATCRGK